MAPATVTTPVVESIANLPPALLVSEYVTPLVVASASEAEAVIPTSVPFDAFSFTAFVVPSLSTGVVTANSFASLIAIVNV